jgi:intracellular multiplication protein IcmK
MPFQGSAYPGTAVDPNPTQVNQSGGGGSGARPKNENPNVSKVDASPAGADVEEGEMTPEEEKKVDDELLKIILKKTYPLTPAQKKQIHEADEDQVRADLRSPPSYSSVPVDIFLDPAAEMEKGKPTAISFTDQTGQPWPIGRCIVSDEFKGDRPAQGSHVFVFTAQKLVAHGAMICLLEGLPGPAKFKVEVGNAKHFLSVDARVHLNGPAAKPLPADIDGPQLVAGDPVMEAFLYGIPPEGAEPVAVAGGGSQTKAWDYRGAIWVRTPMVLMAPTALRQNVLNGFHAFKVGHWPVLEFDDDGHDVVLRLTGMHPVSPKIPADFLAKGDAPPRPQFTSEDDDDLSEVPSSHGPAARNTNQPKGK